MIDLGISKLALIGAVALIVIGPEKLPRVARTVGALLGKAQRYVADVKAEVNRAMDIEELKRMRSSVESAARDVESQVSGATSDFESSWNDATKDLPGAHEADFTFRDPPSYQRPNKRWRIKRQAVPRWYKARQGVRSQIQSGAARVARFRPPGAGPRGGGRQP